MSTLENDTTQPTKTKKPFYKRWWFITLAVFFGLGLFGSTLESEEEPEKAPVAVVETTEAPEPTPEPEPVETTPEPEPTVEVDPRFEMYQDGTNTFVQYAVSDNLTMNLIRVGAQVDTVEAIQAAIATYPDYEQITVTGTFPTADEYGNTNEDSIVLNVIYSRTTVEKINFDNFNYENVWEIRDGGFVHHELL